MASVELRKNGECLNFFSIFDETIALKCLYGVTLTTKVDHVTDKFQKQVGSAQFIPVDGFGFDASDVKMSCSTCGIVKFDDRREQVLHYKTDWHCHNLKRRLDDKPALDRTIYEESLTASCRESTSEDDSPDEIVESAIKHARLFFRNEGGYLFSVHKCVIMSKTQAGVGDADVVERINELKACQKWAVILLGGGHFAAAIFNGQDVVIHKTLHRYVVRAKQGTAQGTHDRSRPAVSAGAALRRHNEQALESEVQTLMVESWNAYLRDCNLVFYRSAGFNRRILFGGKKSMASPFNRQDSRLRNIPFATKKASFKEVVRVHAKLATVQCHGIASEFQETVVRREKHQSPRKVAPVDRAVKVASNCRKSCERSGKHHQGAMSSASESENDDSSEDEIVWETEEVVCSFSQLETFECSSPQRRRQNKKISNDPTGDGNTSRNRLYTACKLGRLEVIREIVTTTINTESEDVEEFLNRPFGKMDTTYLHVVARNGYSDAVAVLLECGADPACMDFMGHSPYTLAVDADTRKQFRRFRARFPDRYDYKAANIPSPLSEEDEKAKSERQKLLRRQRRQRGKEQTTETKERDAFLNLSDTQKTKVASSAGAATLPRCFTCGESLQGRVPFEYEQYKFCHIPCLKEHRLKIKKQP